MIQQFKTKSAEQKMKKNKRRKRSQARCVKFIYVAKQTKFITKLFKNANLKISFKTINTIGKLIDNNKTINPNKFNKCGIYQLICQDCKRKYMGQIDRPFYTRCQDHFHNYKDGNGISKFAQHRLENKHSIGTMEDIMEILHVTKKGEIMNTLEKFHICNEIKLDNQINDKCTIKSNVIFDTIRNTSRGHVPL
jgi:hypothetical protein